MFNSKGNKNNLGKNFSERYNNENMKNSTRRLMEHLDKTKPSISNEAVYDNLKNNFTLFQILARYRLSPILLQRTLAELRLQSFFKN